MLVFFQQPGFHSAEMRAWRGDPRGVMQDKTKKVNGRRRAAESNPTTTDQTGPAAPHGRADAGTKGSLRGEMNLRLEITDLSSSAAVASPQLPGRL